MDRKKERYLVALRASVKGTGLLEEIKTSREDWVNAGEKQVAASVIKGRRKYVVVWNCEVAETNKKERESKIIKAEEELNAILGSIENGEITSRAERDEKIGYVKRKYQVTKYLHTKGNKKRFSFTIEKTKALDEVEKYDGYQVFVTIELDLSEKDVVESYRTRGQIEKAIRIWLKMKNFMKWIAKSLYSTKLTLQYFAVYLYFSEF